MSTKTLSWNALFMNGSVISLSTSMWRARVQIKPGDLGIENSAEVATALSLGCHRLAPASAFEAILKPAREAARTIEYYSVNFGLITGARYVPEKNLEKLTTELRRLKAEFYTAVDEFMAKYETTKAQMMPVIQQALKDAARSESAAASAFERIVAEYPSAAEVRSKFGLAWSVYAIRSPKEAGAEEFAQQEAEEVKSIVADMVKQLRGEMTEKMADILKVVAKGGKLPSRSVESAYSLLDRIESLNILGDAVLADQVKAMRDALNGVNRDEVGAGFVSGLEDMKAALDQSVEQAIAEAEASLTGVGRRRLVVGNDDPTNVVELPIPAEMQEELSQQAEYESMGL